MLPRQSFHNCPRLRPQDHSSLTCFGRDIRDRLHGHDHDEHRHRRASKRSWTPWMQSVSEEMLYPSRHDQRKEKQDQPILGLR
jgi:hypothetical protein